jgi:hypothetical protein
VNVISHYSREEVKKEIYEFLKGRWAAIEGEDKRWIRWKDDRPLVINDSSDVLKIIKENAFIKPRSFYGTIEVFGRLEEKADVESKYDFNVLRATPFLDIDVIDESLIDRAWIYVVKIAKIIVNYLCKEENVCKSVYVLWTGAGAHVRINDNALSSEVLKEDHPINIAFAISEYILRRTGGDILKIVKESGGIVKVENIVSQKRVFTAPLSLHRRLDRVAVTIKPEDLDLFTLSWTEIDFYRHDPEAWRRFERGEADDLAKKALKAVRGETKRTVIEEVVDRGRKALAPEGIKIGRFPVMALLQAARYYLLTGDLEKAKSFGLNRAIFYAWAKYYGPARSASARIRSIGKKIGKEEMPSKVEWAEVVGEKVKVSKNGWFVMGDVEQRPEDFDKNVIRRFEEVGINFERAWRAALDYVSRFPRSVLENPQRFFKEVYEPVRDNFVDKVLNAKWEPRPRFNLYIGLKERTSERSEIKKRSLRKVGLDKWLKG